MHSFPFQERVAGEGGRLATPSSCGNLLDLGVGGSGIVGRCVSVVDASQQTLGVGIIGWG